MPNLLSPNFSVIAPLWTFYGALLSSQVFPSPKPVKRQGPYKNLDWWALGLCVGTVWAISVLVEALDSWRTYRQKPGQVSNDESSVGAQRQARSSDAVPDATAGEEGNPIVSPGPGPVSSDSLTQAKSISDRGSYESSPRRVTLLIALSFTFVMLYLAFHPNADRLVAASRAGMASLPFRGLTIPLCALLVLASNYQRTLNPQHGLSTFLLALTLAPLPALIGLVGHYTATTGRAVSFFDLFVGPQGVEQGAGSGSGSGVAMDAQLWAYLGAFSSVELARAAVYRLSWSFRSPPPHAPQPPAAITDTDINQNAKAKARTLSQTLTIYLLCFASCAVCSGVIFYHQKRNSGMVLRVAGASVDENISAKLGVGWSTGAILISTYSVPIVLINLKTLLALRSERRGSRSRSGSERDREGTRGEGISVLSPVSTLELRKVVELNAVQAIVTPIMLALVMSATVFIVGTDGK